tara:strand:- start:70 stop:342 length:273 start_codon:yes stop_codon:yes gene_type:complete
MKTLTKVEYSNEKFSRDGQYTAYVTCANDESLNSLTEFIENKTNIESLRCGGDDNDGRVYDTFSSEWHMNKAEFMQELRSTVKEWKSLKK